MESVDATHGQLHRYETFFQVFELLSMLSRVLTLALPAEQG